MLENCGIDYLINEIGRLCDGIFVKEKYLLGRLWNGVFKKKMMNIRFLLIFIIIIDRL